MADPHQRPAAVDYDIGVLRDFVRMVRAATVGSRQMPVSPEVTHSLQTVAEYAEHCSGELDTWDLSMASYADLVERQAPGGSDATVTVGPTQ